MQQTYIMERFKEQYEKQKKQFFLADFFLGFFLCTFLDEENLVYEQSSTDKKKKILMKYFLQWYKHTETA